jgi:hypothetical protein
MRTVADKKPPVAANDAELAMFYYERAIPETRLRV